MPTPPSPSQTTDAQLADAQAKAQAKALATLRQLNDLSVELAAALQANALRQVQAATSLAKPVPEASMAAFDCTARSARRTALTLQQMAQDMAQDPAQPPRPATPPGTLAASPPPAAPRAPGRPSGGMGLRHPDDRMELARMTDAQLADALARAEARERGDGG